MDLGNAIFTVSSFIGFPSLLALFVYLVKRTHALTAGVQAMLRDRLRYLGKKYVTQGWVSMEDKEDWENMYQQYHGLGKNGVMDGLRERVLNLQTEPPKKREERKNEK